jgi:Domain of unknown function (DUF4440)
MLKDNESRWSAAIAKHDIATIESMVAADFIGVNSKGKVQNRRAMLAEAKNDKEHLYLDQGRETRRAHVRPQRCSCRRGGQRKGHG